MASTTNSLQAFKECSFLHKIRGFAVTNEEGKIYAHVSLSDLLRLDFDTIEMLRENLGDLVKYLNNNGSPKLISVKSDTSFVDILKTMIENKIHRVYVTDDDGDYVGVVSATNVVGAIAEPMVTNIKDILKDMGFP